MVHSQRHEGKVLHIINEIIRVLNDAIWLKLCQIKSMDVTIYVKVLKLFHLVEKKSSSIII